LRAKHPRGRDRRGSSLMSGATRDQGAGSGCVPSRQDWLLGQAAVLTPATHRSRTQLRPRHEGRGLRVRGELARRGVHSAEHLSIYELGKTYKASEVIGEQHFEVPPCRPPAPRWMPPLECSRARARSPAFSGSLCWARRPSSEPRSGLRPNRVPKRVPNSAIPR
jgi:hypothetical protein